MNILVIDDEPLIHISIEKLIHSCFSDANVFHAYNGNEMLTVLSQREFLLAFVDIKMPGLSGLEAIRQAKELAPMTKYYIMTGFNEFEYAKQAIKLKVEDYLMKPLDRKTIQETIQTALQLDRTARRERKNVFRNWMETTLNGRESSLGEYNGYYCSLILVTVDHCEFPKNTLVKTLMPYDDNFVSCFVGNHILLLCFSADFEVLQQIRANLSAQTYNNGITLFSSSIMRNTKNMKLALKQLLQYSSLRIIFGIEKFYFLKPLLNNESILLSFCQLCISWQNAYQSKNYTDFVNLSDRICTHSENNETYLKYRDHILNFFAQVLALDHISASDTATLKKCFQECARKLLPASGSDRTIDAIIEFIQSHYCENLSAASLSERFGLSANYISSLLKQELGIRYNDYITQLRLNHAKELLITTNHSVKDITVACGYFSQSHFTKLFLEHIGCTPAEYRKNTKKK